jgi:hypothetical protein
MASYTVWTVELKITNNIFNLRKYEDETRVRAAVVSAASRPRARAETGTLFAKRLSL